MSGSLLDTVLPQGLFAAGWRARLRPASFRGVPFFVVEGAGFDGRNLALHVFPLRDQHQVEDLGRTAPRITVTGYVVGPDYIEARDRLLKALTGTGEPGTLVLPTLGQRQVHCETVRYAENLKEAGFCAFDISFIEARPLASEGGELDRFQAALRQVAQVLRLARQGYALVAAARGDLTGFARAAVLSWAQGTAQDIAGAWLGLPGLDLAGTERSIEDLRTTSTSDPATLALQVAAPAEAFGAVAGTEGRPAVTGAGAAETTTSTRIDLPQPGRVMDLLLARTGAPLPSDAAAARAAVLEREAACACAVSAALRAAWATSQAALAARDRLAAALLDAADAAADRGEAELSVALMGLLGLARADLSARAARLPDLARYAVPGPLPALALAHRLYADAARADDLVAFNATPHPAFMPAEGLWPR